MADEKDRSGQKGGATDTTPADSAEGERGSTVHGGGLGGNELGGRESSVGTVTEDDLTPGERRRSGHNIQE